MKILLQNGANIFATSSYGATALHFAAQSGKAELVQMLINNGAHVEIKERKNGMTPLLWACQNGHTDVVNILVQFGSNIKTTGYHEYTALHFAIERKD